MSHSQAIEVLESYKTRLDRIYKRKYEDGFTLEDATNEVYMRGTMRGAQDALDLLRGCADTRDIH